MRNSITQLTPAEQKENVKNNVYHILFYSLCLAVALGFNDLITTMFDSFPNNKHIIAKTIYVVIMFGTTIITAYYLGSSVQI
jgi:hypothetical protein